MCVCVCVCVCVLDKYVNDQIYTDLQINKFYFFKLTEKFVEKHIVKFFLVKKKDISQCLNILWEKLKFKNEIQQFCIVCACERSLYECVTT